MSAAAVNAGLHIARGLARVRQVSDAMPAPVQGAAVPQLADWRAMQEPRARHSNILRPREQRFIADLRNCRSNLTKRTVGFARVDLRKMRHSRLIEAVAPALLGDRLRSHMGATSAAFRRRSLIVIPTNEEPRRAATRYRGQRSSKRHDQYAPPPPPASSSC